METGPGSPLENSVSHSLEGFIGRAHDAPPLLPGAADQTEIVPRVSLPLGKPRQHARIWELALAFVAGGAMALLVLRLLAAPVPASSAAGVVAPPPAPIVTPLNP